MTLGKTSKSVYLPISLNTSLFVGQDCLIMKSFPSFCFSALHPREPDQAAVHGGKGDFHATADAASTRGTGAHRRRHSRTVCRSGISPPHFLVVVYMDHRWWVPPGSITIVRLTSCLTGLDLAALFMLNYIQIYKFGQIQTSQIGCQP